MRKLLVIAAAGGALAIGVPAAFAVGDSAQTPATTLQPVQTAEPEAQRPDGDDCPEKDGGGGGESNAPTGEEI